jgi:hypothetical protein
MANNISIKRSSVTGKAPQPADLIYGELALNYADGVLYYKKSNNSIDILNKDYVQSVDISSSDLTVTNGPITSSGTINLALNTVPVSKGGTGATTASSAINNLLPAQTGYQNYVLTTTGSEVVWAPVTPGGTLPTASTTVLGGVKIDGATIAIDGNGVISATGYGLGTVTSINASGGTTGLSFTGGPITSQGTLTLSGTLGISNGGTGQTTQQAALNALSGTQTANRVLRSDGTNVTLSQVALATDVSGTLPVASGGTGVVSFDSGYLISNGTSLTSTETILGSDIFGDISGKSSNVTGVVAVVNGGTGTTTSTGTGSVVLSVSPIITGSASFGSISTSGNVTIAGNLVVSGTTTTINSTTTTLQDPILTLGGSSAPEIDDNKDRGVEFRYHNGTSAKVGFFGYDDSTGYLTFIPDASNTNEVFSGDLGDIQASNFRGSVVLPGSTSGNITLQATATAGANTITLPATTGTVVTTGDTGTVTNTMLAGSITNNKLSNSSLTINGSEVSLGGTTTVTATATNALTIGTGLTGISYNGSSAVTIGIDGTVATLTDSQTLSNKTINGANNTITNISLTSGVTGTLPVANGGTGQTSFTSGYIKSDGTTLSSSSTVQGADVSGDIAGNAENVNGTVSISNGGTGATTHQAALNNLVGTQTANRVLRSDGDDVTLSQVELTSDVSGVLPVANGGTGQSSFTSGYIKSNGAMLSSSSTVPGSDVSGNISGNAANVTGVVAIANGGTGATNTSDAINALMPTQTGSSGKYLTTNGVTVSWDEPIFRTTVNTTTVTANQVLDSVNASAFSSVKYAVQVKYGTKIHVEEMLVTHDGTESFIVRYAKIASDVDLASFSVALLNGNFSLTTTPVYANSEYKITRIVI